MRSRYLDQNHRSRWFKSKIKKLQGAGFTPTNLVLVFNNVETEQASFDVECQYITAIGRSDLKSGPLLNMTSGGDGCSGRKLSEHHMTVLRARKGKIKFPTLQGIRGEAHHNYGRKHSEQTRIKRAAHWKAGDIRSENAKQNHIQRMKGNTINAATWIVFHPDGKQSEEFNLAEFGRQHGISGSALSEVASGKRKSHKGYRCQKLQLLK